MNQHNVVGIGNIYANEILFDAKIRPTRKSKTITKKEHHRIAASTKKILKIAIKAGGTTLKDFYQPDGNKGYFKIDLAVYDRANEKCINCNKESIKRENKPDPCFHPFFLDPHFGGCVLRDFPMALLQAGCS